MNTHPYHKASANIPSKKENTKPITSSHLLNQTPKAYMLLTCRGTEKNFKHYTTQEYLASQSMVTIDFLEILLKVLNLITRLMKMLREHRTYLNLRMFIFPLRSLTEYTVI